MTETDNTPAPQSPSRGKKQHPQQPANNRKLAARIVALIAGIAFALTSMVIVEARQTSFYGEPLLSKMIQVVDKKIHGLPKDPEQRARVVTGVSNLYLLPPEAVLPASAARRFRRIGTQFGYVTGNAKMGTKYECHTSDINRIPLIAIDIAIALESLPEDLLRRVQMEYIVFCGNLITDTGPVAGFPAPPDNVMFLNLTNRYSGHDVQALFFHEFYHLFEARFGLVRDPYWLQNFNAGYHNSYQGLMRPVTNEIGTGGYGFINSYSHSFPYEDRAEIFSALTASRSKLIPYIRQSHDEMLAAKTQYIAETAQKYLGVDYGPLWGQ